MITIKLPYTSENFDILTYQKQYSILIRYCYNRLCEGKTQEEIKKLCYTLNNIELVNNSWFVQNAFNEAKTVYKRDPSGKVIFGGKKNFYDRLKGKKDKLPFIEKRLYPVIIQGETRLKGNRFFTLNIIDNNQIIFKPNWKTKIILDLPKINKNYLKKLSYIEEKSKNKELPFCVKLDSRFIYISFEEENDYDDGLKQNRYIGIDSNPEFIGITVFENDKLIDTKLFSLTKIISKIKILNKASNSKQSKYLQNKLNFEILQISKNISKLAIYHKCKFIFVEDFSKKISSNNHHKGRPFNRLINNLWKKEILFKNLEKRINIVGGRLFRINPAYTSYIGNLKFDYPDPINASMEIARRGYDVIILKNKKFYPSLTITVLKDQWKEYFNEGVKDWKELCQLIKKSKVKYRVSLDECNHSFKVFSAFHKKSYIDLYEFR
ncbi:hypothetical protein M0P65_06775 [Candidatus Gracilibacteria bacterium]|jgi:hypothetical protein|nr:hypothetical protein [Candidatus Gracilibacteria bacterium]